MESFKHGGYFILFSALCTPFLVNIVSYQRLLMFFIIGLASTVFIDFDHFLLEYMNTGKISKLWDAAKQPLRTLTDPEYLELSTTEEQRMRAHLLIILTLTALTVPYFVLGTIVIVKQILTVVLVSILFHICLDVYSDREEVEKFRDYLRTE